MFRSEIELKTKKCSLLTPDLQLVTLQMSQSKFRNNFVAHLKIHCSFETISKICCLNFLPQAVQIRSQFCPKTKASTAHVLHEAFHYVLSPFTKQLEDG